MTTYDDSNHT